MCDRMEEVPGRRTVFPGSYTTAALNDSGRRASR